MKQEISQKNYGYYPTRQIVTQTALNIDKIQNGGQVGQGVHAICLDGPPGAGKSFYASTYRKLLRKTLNEEIELISHQCTSSTGKAELYEEINITAAITDDANNVIISGKLVEAIEKVNEGKKVILFLDEYDKSRNETDAFLLNFLQDGEIDTTQKGKMIIKEECLKNLQVIICKNDERELSGPLSRRLKSIKLDYMKPEILCRTINKVLKESTQAIRDTVIMLYTAVYNGHKNGNYAFERLPACSECMQAIKDAETLMDMGAGKEDIVTTAIVANMFKSENDIETFTAIVKNNSEISEWYQYLVDRISENDEQVFEDVKLEMARNFYPEQLKVVTRELEEKKEELEKEKKKLKQTTEEYERKSEEIKNKSKELEEREKRVEELAKETKILRENAQEDAIKEAKKVTDEERKNMQTEYDKKNEELITRENETKRLRETAEEDAIQKAQEVIEEEKRKTEELFNQKAEELNKKVEERIQQVNAQIDENNKIVDEKLTDYNHIKMAKDDAQKLLQQSEKDLIKSKQLLEKLLGREILPSDFEMEGKEQEENVEIDENKTFKIQETIEGEIQTKGNSNSVFDISSSDSWIQIGEIQIEENEDKEKLKFNGEASEKLGNILTGEKYKQQNTMVCDDGIVLYQGFNNKIVAVRVINKEAEQYQNKYQFYSNTTVVPLQAIKMIANIVGNLNACGINIVGKKPISMQLNCLVYSNKQHKNTKEATFEEIDENVYYLKYQNKTEKIPLKIAECIISQKGINCSTKGMTKEELDGVEKKAFIKHCEIKNGSMKEQIDKIEEITCEKIETIQGEDRQRGKYNE